MYLQFKHVFFNNLGPIFVSKLTKTVDNQESSGTLYQKIISNTVSLKSKTDFTSTSSIEKWNGSINEFKLKYETSQVARLGCSLLFIGLILAKMPLKKTLKKNHRSESMVQ
eukprot:NODE_664_length_4906_cov_0.509049.p5 type:complete len:111 gc:universal NODE_664_length_4906_cov_0.509049:4572-4240(-)